MQPCRLSKEWPLRFSWDSALETPSESESLSVMSASLWPHGLCSPWNSQAKHLDEIACREVSSYSVLPSRWLLVSKQEEWDTKEPNKCKSSKAKRLSRGCGCLLVLGDQTWRSGPTREEGHPAKKSPRLSNETLYSTRGLRTNQTRPGLKKVETWPQMIPISLL